MNRRAPFQPDDVVFGIYYSAGTCGAYGLVVSCDPRPDGQWTLTVDGIGDSDADRRTYTLHASGHSDAVSYPLNLPGRLTPTVRELRARIDAARAVGGASGCW